MIQVFIWLYAVGIFAQDSSPRDRVAASNLFPLAKSLHSELDASPATIVLLPTRATLVQCIELAWQVLADEELRMASRPSEEPWHLEVASLLAAWPYSEPTTDMPTGMPVFQHRLELFGSRVNGEEIAADLLSSSRGFQTRLPEEASDTWPWTLEPALPSRWLFVNPILSALCAQAAIQGLQPREENVTFSREFMLDMDLIDYLLALVETDGPSRWRVYPVPSILSSQPPPSCSVSAQQPRLYYHMGKTARTATQAETWQTDYPQFSSDDIVPDDLQPMDPRCLRFPSLPVKIEPIATVTVQEASLTPSPEKSPIVDATPSPGVARGLQESPSLDDMLERFGLGDGDLDSLSPDEVSGELFSSIARQGIEDIIGSGSQEALSALRHNQLGDAESWRMLDEAAMQQEARETEEANRVAEEERRRVWALDSSSEDESQTNRRM